MEEASTPAGGTKPFPTDNACTKTPAWQELKETTFALRRIQWQFKQQARRWHFENIYFQFPQLYNTVILMIKLSKTFGGIDS